MGFNSGFKGLTFIPKYLVTNDLYKSISHVVGKYFHNMSTYQFYNSGVINNNSVLQVHSFS